jgi:dolichol kinase
MENLEKAFVYLGEGRGVTRHRVHENGPLKPILLVTQLEISFRNPIQKLKRMITGSMVATMVFIIPLLIIVGVLFAAPQIGIGLLTVAIGAGLSAVAGRLLFRRPTFG